MTDHISFTTNARIEALCGRLAAANAPQLPFYRAALDLGIAVWTITETATAWPAALAQQTDRPTCVLIGGDPGYGEADPAPCEWAVAKRLKYWCRAAIIHGTGGSPHDYRQAALVTLTAKRLAFIETTSRRAAQWADFLKCPRTLVLIPPGGGLHPVPPRSGAVH